MTAIAVLGAPPPKKQDEEPRRPSDMILQEIKIHLKCIGELRRELHKQGLSLNFFQDASSGQLMCSLVVFRGVEG
jgi:hypothetical protein